MATIDDIESFSDEEESDDSLFDDEEYAESEDFDEYTESKDFEAFVSEFKDENGGLDLSKDPMALQRLKEAAEKAKKLSHLSPNRIVLGLPSQ